MGSHLEELGQILSAEDSLEQIRSDLVALDVRRPRSEIQPAASRDIRPRRNGWRAGHQAGIQASRESAPSSLSS